MVRFAKERSDKTEDGSGWMALRAKVLKPSTQFEFWFSDGLNVRLYRPVKLLVVPGCFKENTSDEVRDKAHALA